MLIDLRVENHRSLRDEAALTFEAAGPASDDPRPRVVPGAPSPLLPALGLYGANASGKSNVLSALGFLRDALADSQVAWPAEGGVPRDAFAWASGPTAPSLFEVTVVLGGVRHQYGFVVDSQVVREEWLYAWPRGRKQVWFERDGDTFSFGDHLRGENRAVANLTRPNALFVSAAAQHHHAQLQPLYAWARAVRTVRVEGYRARFADALPAATAAAMFAALAAGAAATTTGWVRLGELLPDRRPDELRALGALDPEDADAVRELLRAADLGVTDFRVEPSEDRGKSGPPRVSLRHAAPEPAWLALEQESAGTVAMLRLAPALLGVLRHGGLLLIDELEAGLHPLLAMEILRRFQSPVTNPRHAQLLFTTHDTQLLGTSAGPPLLRRDQVWLTEKAADGATRLFPLTDYKPRTGENLERGYLAGRYGAVPVLPSENG
jgi:hypothetical protein